MSGLQLRLSCRWGTCWLACALWDQLQLDLFWQPRLPPSRKGTRWFNVIKTLVAYRLLGPGSAWRLHRQWYDRSAMGYLLGENFAVAHSHTLYRCLDKLRAHKRALFCYLKERWRDLFDARFEVLIYDLTSTYFECDPPEYGKPKHDYSRDKRPDCMQVVIHTAFTGTAPEVRLFTLDDLRDAAERRVLKWAFVEPERLRPGRTTAALTEQAPGRFGDLAQALGAGGHDPRAVGHFCIRLLFCLFAEDIELLPRQMFSRLLAAGEKVGTGETLIAPASFWVSSP